MAPELSEVEQVKVAAFGLDRPEVEAAPSDTDARAAAFAEAERRWPDPFVGRLAAIEDFAEGAEWWASRSPEAAPSDDSEVPDLPNGHAPVERLAPFVARRVRSSQPVQVEVTDPESRPWIPNDGDTRCQQCGSRNPVWWTHADIWNALMPDDGVLCPTCFHRAWLASAALGGGDRAE